MFAAPSTSQTQPSRRLAPSAASNHCFPIDLDIDLDHAQTDRESMGGTHASPRLHLRRGHARQYAEGKYCWVQPHVVGNKKLGMVHKDYRAITSAGAV